jgi:hypothetical protein
MAILAEGGIEQRFARGDVRSLLRTDRERSGFRGEGDRGLDSSHGTSVLACRAAASGRVQALSSVRK